MPSNLILFLLLLMPPLSLADSSAQGAVDGMSKWGFPIPAILKKNVDFWIRVNSQYSIHQGLVHDSENIDHVYSVLDLSKSKRNSNHLIAVEKLKWKRVLLAVHAKQGHPEKMNSDEKRIFEMFKDTEEPNKFLNAAHRKRLRFQLGQKEQFLNGLRQSGKYMKKMEEVFARAGLPIELTRLPFVESSFNLRARSKVGASGIWQFMKSTARLFLRVDTVVDERNDPIRASEAAVRLLTVNYRSLGNWPLAVTAYNHGRKGLMRAVRRVGSDQWGDLVEGYSGRSFGFASRNFFPELLALIELEKNSAKYFGDLERAAPLYFYEVSLPIKIDLKRLIQWFELNSQEVRELNPGLSEAVFRGAEPVPAGYRFRLRRRAEDSEETLVKAFLSKFDSASNSPLKSP